MTDRNLLIDIEPTGVYSFPELVLTSQSNRLFTILKKSNYLLAQEID